MTLQPPFDMKGKMKKFLGCCPECGFPIAVKDVWPCPRDNILRETTMVECLGCNKKFKVKSLVESPVNSKRANPPNLWERNRKW